MRLLFIIVLLIFVSLSEALGVCIDETNTEIPQELFSVPYRFDLLPQKITKTVQGITFTSDYDNGSLEDVTSGGLNVFNCKIYEEPGALGSRKYWFRFKMTGVAGRTITLNIEHPSNPRPVITKDGKSWRRLTAEETPSTTQIQLTFSPTENFAELAFFYPLGVAETYEAVSALVRNSDDASTQIIGQSFQGRDIWMVTVTDTSVPDTGKHRVWMHSRAHAGEVTSTHLLLGFLEQITEDSPVGKRLRRYCIFNIVPLENVDGVYLGHTRWDSQGFDPERDWCYPVTLPEVLSIKTQVDSLMASANPIEVALNLHSTQGNYLDTFFFKHIYPSVTHHYEEIEQRFIDAFDNATPLFDNLNPQTSQLHECQFIESYFWNNWGESVMALTHEGHFQRRITDNEWITADDYRELGRAMARALIEYFNLPELAGSEINVWAFR